MQHEFDCYYCIVDWHSLTTHPDTKDLQENVLRLMSELIGSGLDPEKCVLYIQSDVPEIAELYLYLNMMAYQGELERTATFKDKVRMQPDNVNAGIIDLSCFAICRHFNSPSGESAGGQRPGRSILR